MPLIVKSSLLSKVPLAIYRVYKWVFSGLPLPVVLNADEPFADGSRSAAQVLWRGVVVILQLKRSTLEFLTFAHPTPLSSSLPKNWRKLH